MSKRGRPLNFSTGYNSDGYSSEPNAAPKEYSIEDLMHDIENIKTERYSGPDNQLGMPQHLGGILGKIAEVRKSAAKLDKSDEKVKGLLRELDTLKLQIESSRKTWSKDIFGSNSNSNSNSEPSPAKRQRASNANSNANSNGGLFYNPANYPEGLPGNQLALKAPSMSMAEWIKRGANGYSSNSGYSTNATTRASQGGGKRKTRRSQRSRKNKNKSRRSRRS
jgi:hypothetical protein